MMEWGTKRPDGRMDISLPLMIIGLEDVNTHRYHPTPHLLFMDFSCKFLSSVPVDCVTSSADKILIRDTHKVSAALCAVIE